MHGIGRADWALPVSRRMKNDMPIPACKDMADAAAVRLASPADRGKLKEGPEDQDQAEAAAGHRPPNGMPVTADLSTH